MKVKCFGLDGNVQFAQGQEKGNGEDWQPAIIRPTHLVEKYNDKTNAIAGKKVRVRPTRACFETMQFREELGCDAKDDRFFQIHPEDVARIAPWHTRGEIVICEHEILTD